MPESLSVNIPSSSLDLGSSLPPQIERVNIWLEASPCLSGSTFNPTSPTSSGREYQLHNETRQATPGDRISSVRAAKSPVLTSPTSKTGSRGWIDIEQGNGRSKNTQAAEIEPGAEPRSWRHILAGMVLLFNCWGVNFAYGVFQEYYANWLLWGTSQSKVAWIGSTQLGFTFLLAMPVGKAFDAGYFRQCFFTGAIFLWAGQLGLGACTSWKAIFFTQGVMMGVGSGLMFVSGTLYITSFYDEKLDVVMSIISMGGPLGGIVYTTIAQQLLRHSTFKVACLAMGGMMTVTTIPAFFAFLEKPNQKGKPRQIVDLGIFGEPSYMAICVGMALSFWGLYLGFYFIVVYAIDVLAMYPTEATNFLIAMLGVNIAGRLFAIIVSRDLLGPLTTLTFFTAMCASCMNLWMNVGKKWELYFVGCVYGFVSAGVQGLFVQSISAFIAKNSPTRGFRMGIAMTGIGFGALTGSPLGGALLAKRTPFPFCWMQLFATVVLYAGVLCFLLARYLRVGWTREMI